MHQQEVLRNIIVYNKALSVLEGQWQDALCILKQLQGDELQPDLLTFSSLISCSLRGSASKSALFLWSELLRHQVEPDYICLNSAVNACAASGAWPSAIFFLQEVKRLRLLQAESEKLHHPLQFGHQLMWQNMASSFPTLAGFQGLVGESIHQNLWIAGKCLRQSSPVAEGNLASTLAQWFCISPPVVKLDHSYQFIFRSFSLNQCLSSVGSKCFTIQSHPAATLW